jgi:hypothetical protein
MPASDTDIALQEGNCYRCYGDLDIATILRLVFMARAVIAVDPTADVTPQGLLTWGACYRCLGLSFGQIMEISLADMLSQSLAV